jgi:hypothetical protein
MDEIGSRLPFERERLQFCEKMYDVEKMRGELLERKAQVYLTLLTFLLGVLTLKLDSWQQICLSARQFARSHPVWGGLLVIEALVCAVAMAGSFLAIAMVLRPRSRGKPYPRDLVNVLFNPVNDDGTDKMAEKLLRNNAQQYALAVEINNRVNTEISKWALSLSLSCLTALVAVDSLAATLCVTYWLF